MKGQPNKLKILMNSIPDPWLAAGPVPNPWSGTSTQCATATRTPTTTGRAWPSLSGSSPIFRSSHKRRRRLERGQNKRRRRLKLRHRR